MGGSIMSVFKGIPDVWRGLGVIVAAISVGGMIALTVVGFIDMPDRVTQAEVDIARNTTAIVRDSLAIEDVREEGEHHDEKLDRIICILEASASSTSAMGCS